MERLVDGQADLILHHIDKADPRLEFIDLFAVKIVPVVAPNFLRFPISKSITPEAMRDYVQCVNRDSARHSPPRDYYLLEGARSWTVSDELMKRELILQGNGLGAHAAPSDRTRPARQAPVVDRGAAFPRR